MMRFCQSCNNLLYPRENRDTRKLEYACRAPCTFVERNIEGACVFRNELVKDSSTRLDVILSAVNKVIINLLGSIFQYANLMCFDRILPFSERVKLAVKVVVIMKLSLFR